jgi:hypothetical protein
MLIESIRDMARAIENDTGRKVARVCVGRSVMAGVVIDARKRTFAVEYEQAPSGLRVVRVAGLEIRERPWELGCEVRFEVG